MKKIAVLMSTYNGEKYLKEQIDSILAQKCEYEIKLIVRDDGSNDKTISILDEYKTKGLLNYYSDINLGPGYSFLKMVIDNPGYDYYAFSDQDDFWYEDKLQKAVKSISFSNNYALYCSNSEMCDASLVPLGRNVHRSMKFYNCERVFFGLACAQGCTCVFNKRLAEVIQEKGMPQNIILHDSFVTCLCFALEGFFYADEAATMKYRMHGKNVGGLSTKSQGGILRMIKSRIRDIFRAPRNSIINQLTYILTTYKDHIKTRELKILSTVLKSKTSIIKRIKIVFAKEIQDESINLDVANRLKLLLNNF